MLGAGGRYADARIPSGVARLAGATFTGAAAGITPTADAHFATKAYVDGLLAPVQDHTNFIAISADTTFDPSEFTDAGTGDSSTTTSLVVPTFSGVDRYIAIAVPDAEGDITAITQGGFPIFSSWERISGTIEINSVTHKVWRTTAIQSDLASGLTYVITQA